MSTPSPSEHRETPAAASPQAEPEPIDLLTYLKRLGSHWLAGLIAAVIVAGAMFAVGATSSSGADAIGTVWARSHVMMTLPGTTSEAQAQLVSDAAPRIISSYVAVQNADPLLKDTAAILNDGTTTGTLQKAVSMYWGGGSQVIAFYALGTDQQQAEKRADAYAQAFIKNSPTLLPPAVAGTMPPTFTVVQKAFPSAANPMPTAGASSSTSKLLGSPVVDVVAGVVIGLLVMAGLELRSSRRRT